MSTDTDTTAPVTETTEAETATAEQSLGERVAADLATLGELAKSSPQIADLVAVTVSQLYIVIAQHSPVGPGDVLDAAAALGVGAPTVSVDGWFAGRDVDLPARVVRLSVIHLQPPTEQAAPEQAAPDSLFGE